MTRPICALAVSALMTNTLPLPHRDLPTAGHVDHHVIVGRARCGGVTWLLTDAPELIEVKLTERSIVGRSVRGVRPDERPWGLACVGAGDLWTLASARTLARLSSSGDLLSRTKLRQPRLNLFGVGEWLVLQHPASTAGAPLLGAARLADVNRVQPWPGPTVRATSSSRLDLPSALVACGLGDGGRLPCWLTTQSRITVSDGASAHTAVVQPAFLSSTAVDRVVPLWDVALSSSTVWVLTSAAFGEGGHRVGGRLTRSNLQGDDLGGAEVRPRPRLIVSATDRSAVVLTSAGSLVSVEVP